MVDEVLGVIDTGEPLALDAEILGALGTVGEDQRVEAHPLKLGDGERPVGPDGHVAKVRETGIAQDLVELTSEPALHLVLVEEDPVLGEPTWLDVAVEEEDAAAGSGESPGGEEAGRAGAHDCHYVNEIVIVRHWGGT
jgi:hypothetical protein